jgi:hypothetical protein
MPWRSGDAMQLVSRCASVARRWWRRVYARRRRRTSNVTPRQHQRFEPRLLGLRATPFPGASATAPPRLAPRAIRGARLRCPPNGAAHAHHVPLLWVVDVRGARGGIHGCAGGVYFHEQQRDRACRGIGRRRAAHCLARLRRCILVLWVRFWEQWSSLCDVTEFLVVLITRGARRRV